MSDRQDGAAGSPWLQARPRYRPDIEGLRAVAVLIVVLFHAKVPGFEGGFVGVDVFFVLSGYLITWLLVNEAEQKGAVDLARFYARRARRLLPAMAVVLLVTLGVTALLYAPFEQRLLSRTWATTALYVSNLEFASRALDYHGASAETNPLLHTWSLSVEEQFYLAWPWIVVLGLGVGRWRRSLPNPRRLLAVLGLVTVLSFVLSLALTGRGGGWAFYLSPTRAWEFGAGGLAVLVPVGRWPRRRLNAVRPGVATAAWGWAALGGLGLATVWFDSQTPYPGAAALLPVLSTVVLLRAGSPEGAEAGGLGRLLSLRPLQVIGKLSYSWYLWHWPALVFAAAVADPLGPAGRGAAVGVSLGLAYLSYRFVEDPLRHHRALAATPSRSFAMAAGVSAASVAMAVMWWGASIGWSTSGPQEELLRVRNERPQIYQDDCDHFGSAALTVCAYGDSTARQTAVLIGDSHAGQWFPALHAATDSAGWRLVVLTLSACPMVDLPALFNSGLNRVYRECPEWRRSAMETIRSLSPDVTFAASNSGYEVPVEIWADRTRASLSALSEVSDRTVLIVDTPPSGIDITSCLARVAWRPGTLLDPDCTPRGDPEEEARAEAQARAAGSVTGVDTLDLRAEVCEIGVCGAASDGVIRYRDNGHLSRAFARSFGDRFYDLIRETASSSSVNESPDA